MNLNPGELMAAVSYMVDIVPEGCHFHSWKVGLAAERIAAELDPDLRRDVFYGGLLADIGAVGAAKHVIQYPSRRDQLQDAQIRRHPQRSSAFLDWLPGMKNASKYVRAHHEWWDGRGYPDGKSGSDIPLGAQIIGVADAAEVGGCFSFNNDLRHCLHAIVGLAGKAWSSDVVAALVGLTKDVHFYREMMDSAALPAAVSRKVAELEVPSELNNEVGVERVLHVVAALVDVRDPSTSGHSLRTARYAKALAETMGLSDEEIELAYYAGMVHDSGRLGLPTSILMKPERLSDKEMTLVRKHARMTIRIFNCLPDHPEMAALGEVAGHDHERWDGNGYPDGLKGEDIPLISRIISAVDAFDAMISATNYRLLSPKCAVMRLQQGAGSQFDPKVVEAMTAAAQAGVFGLIGLAA
jgi:HD-GYP domain-containing protein (c-di-GMP phosphodiesterase class II)